MAKKISGKQATIQGLMAAGHVIDRTSVSRKYMCFSGGRRIVRDADGNLRLGEYCLARFWIGRSGALRYGRISTETRSHTDTELHRVLQAVGRGEVRLFS